MYSLLWEDEPHSENILLSTVGDEGPELEMQLRNDYGRYAKRLAKYSLVPARNVLVSLCLTQAHRWVGLIVRLNEFNQVWCIYYIVPRDTVMPVNIISMLEKIYGKATKVKNVAMRDAGELNRWVLSNLGRRYQNEIMLQRCEGSEPNDNEVTDGKTLHLLVRWLVHDQVYGLQETLAVRRDTLHNIVITVGLLSQKLKAKYTDNDGSSIWRDLEFLNKLLLPPSHGAAHRYRSMADDSLGAIMDEDLPKLLSMLREIPAVEALAVVPAEGEKSIKNTHVLHNIYVTANFYRDLESLNNIIRYISICESKDFNIATPLGKFALFRTLEILGEAGSDKNLTMTTKNRCRITIDWNLLYSVRNSLAHGEWDREAKKLPENIQGADFNAILRELTAIKEEMLSLQKLLSALDGNMTAILQHYQENPSITKQTPAAIQLLEKEELVDRGFITSQQFTDLKGNIVNMTRGIAGRVRKELGEEHFKPKQNCDTEQELKTASYLKGIIKNINDLEQKEEAQRASMKKNLSAIRKLATQLPKEPKQESIEDFDKIYMIAKDAITKLGKILAQLPSGSYMRTMNRAFAERYAFVVHEKLTISSDAYNSASEIIRKYLVKHKKLAENAQGLMVPLSVFLPSPLTMADKLAEATLESQKLDLSISDEEILQLVCNAGTSVIEETEDFAALITLGAQLQNDQVRFAAAEYMIGRIYSYLNSLYRAQALALEEQLEIHTLRNFLQHGNVYVDISPLTSEEMVVRYGSLFNSWIGSEKLQKSMTNSLAYNAGRYGFTLEQVPGDGNCFFHAVLEQLERLGLASDWNHRSLRELAVNHMREYPAEYIDSITGNDIERYITSMGKDGTYANHQVLVALARALDMNLVAIRDDDISPQVIRRSPTQGASTLYLGYQATVEHYQSLVPSLVPLPNVTSVATILDGATADSWRSSNHVNHGDNYHNVTAETSENVEPLMVTLLPQVTAAASSSLLFNAAAK